MCAVNEGAIIAWFAIMEDKCNESEREPAVIQSL